VSSKSNKNEKFDAVFKAIEKAPEILFLKSCVSSSFLCILGNVLVIFQKRQTQA
jgi:hypothetical protein